MPGKARNTDPITSHEAGESITEDHQLKIYSLIVQCITNNGKPICASRIEEKLGLDPNVVSRRCAEAAKAGLIYMTTIREKTLKGRSAFCWDLIENKQVLKEVAKAPELKVKKEVAKFIQPELFKKEKVLSNKCINKCSDCVHIYSHVNNKSLKYCNAQKGVKTAYGHKKIKATDNACSLFQSILSVSNSFIVP